MESQGMLAQIVRGNWHLISLMVVVIVVAAGFALSSDDAAKASTGDIEERTEIAMNGGNADAYHEQSRWARQTEEENVKEAIENYENELRYNHGGSETAANLYRLGNLYFSKLHDYEKASTHYESLLQQFPNYSGNITVYPNLVTCYERLGDLALTRHTYKRMMEYFGPDSEEYAYAKMKLGL
jgi:tetratricopeptide (TPR) repeat protein